tara:strand:- start:14102 stop:14866 length:765 start_codon:yes stop_codon:yes gene_type:complete
MGELGSFSCGYFIHVFYIDYVSKVRHLLVNAPEHVKFFVTTSDGDIHRELSQIGADFPDRMLVNSVPNRGRNFAPLLIEFGAFMQNLDFCIFLHSKKSKQSRNGAEWSSTNWDFFDFSNNRFLDSLGIFLGNEEIAVLSVLNARVARNQVFGWGPSYKVAKTKIGKKLELHPKRLDKFYFPAGGMFAIKNTELRWISELALEYEDFEEETSQLDGTLAHAIERLIGYSSARTHDAQIVWDPASNSLRVPGVGSK